MPYYHTLHTRAPWHSTGAMDKVFRILTDVMVIANARRCLILLVLARGVMSCAQNRIGVQLLDPDPGIGSCYGRSVAIHGDHVFVGEPDPGGQGRVHVFHRNTGGLNNWGWLQTILPPNIPMGGGFIDGSDFGHLCIVGPGDLVVFRPRKHIYLNSIGAWACADHATLRYTLGIDGLWFLNTAQGGTLISSWLCLPGASCTIYVPILSGSDVLFARSQANLETGGGIPGQPPAPIPGVAIANAESLIDEPTLLFSGSSRVLTVTSDTVITEGLRLYTSEPLLLLDSIDLQLYAPNPSFDNGANPICAHSGLLAVGNENGDSLGMNTGSILLFDLTWSSPSFIGELVSTTPAAGARFGADVELKGKYLSVLGQEYSQPAVIELFHRCASDFGWCSLGQYALMDTSQTLADAFRMSEHGEFLLSTSQSVYLYYDPGIALGVSQIGPSSNSLHANSLNPDELCIHVPEDAASGMLYIADSQGRTIMERTAGPGIITIGISSLASGMYVVRYATLDNWATLLFVKP